MVACQILGPHSTLSVNGVGDSSLQGCQDITMTGPQDNLTSSCALTVGLPV